MHHVSDIMSHAVPPTPATTKPPSPNLSARNGQLPHEVPAERPRILPWHVAGPAALHYALAKAEYFEALYHNRIEPEHFANREHQIIYETAMREFEADAPTDALRIGELLHQEGKTAAYEAIVPLLLPFDGIPPFRDCLHSLVNLKLAKQMGFGSFVSDRDAACMEFPEAPEPISLSLLPVPRFEASLMPESLARWIVDLSDRMGAPPDFAAAAALVSAASLIAGKIGIRPKRADDWTVVPNLWGVAIGRPGQQKSPAVEQAMRPLSRLAGTAMERHAALKQEWDTGQAMQRAERKAASVALERAAVKGEKSRDEMLEMARRATTESDEAAPACRRYKVNDATVEALGEVLRANPQGVLACRDELSGFLSNLEKQGREADRAFYLESWNGGGDFTYDRIGRGEIHIPRVTVSLFGTTQPQVYARYIRDGSQHADGFVQRFQIAVYPDETEFSLVDRSPDAAARERAYRVFDALDRFRPEHVGALSCENGTLPYLHFAEDTQDYFNSWWVTLEMTKLRSGESAVLESHLAKYRSLMPSLALLFHIIDCVDAGAADNLPLKRTAVSLRAAGRAVAWCSYLEAHARRIYQSAFDGDPEPSIRLAERLRNGSLPSPFTYRHVSRKGWSGLTTPEQIDRALTLLEEHGWVRGQDVPTTLLGGRPTREYYIHPKLTGERTAV